MKNTFEKIDNAHQELIDAVNQSGIGIGFGTRIDPNAEEEPAARNEILDIITKFSNFVKMLGNLKCLKDDENVIVASWFPELNLIAKTFADPTMMYFEELCEHIQLGWMNFEGGKALKNDFMLMQAAANGIIGDRDSEITSLEYLKSLNGQVSEGAEFFIRELVTTIYSVQK